MDARACLCECRVRTCVTTHHFFSHFKVDYRVQRCAVATVTKTEVLLFFFSSSALFLYAASDVFSLFLFALCCLFSTDFFFAFNPNFPFFAFFIFPSLPASFFFLMFHFLYNFALSVLFISFCTFFFHYLFFLFLPPHFTLLFSSLCLFSLLFHFFRPLFCFPFPNSDSHVIVVPFPLSFLSFLLLFSFISLLYPSFAEPLALHSISFLSFLFTYLFPNLSSQLLYFHSCLSLPTLAFNMLISSLPSTAHIHPNHNSKTKRIKQNWKIETWVGNRLWWARSERAEEWRTKSFRWRQVNEVVWPWKEAAPQLEWAEQKRLWERSGGGCGAIVHDFRVICYPEAWKELLLENIAACQPGRKPSSLSFYRSDACTCVRDLSTWKKGKLD